MSDRALTIFRKYKDGEIIALFPEIDNGYGQCMSYLHVGQHGGAYYDLVVYSTTPATPEEYTDLKTELESIGYILKIRQKWIRRSR